MGLTDNLSLSEYYDNKRILITGASGYISWNLIRSLSEYSCTIVYYSRNIEKIERHPGEAKFEFIKASYQDETAFQKAVKNVDIIFTALPNGESQKISKMLLKKNTLIDLSADFRLKKSSDYYKWYKIKHKAKNNIHNSIYALPEIKKKLLKIIKLYLVQVVTQHQY